MKKNILYILIFYSFLFSQCDEGLVEDDCGDCWAPYCYCLSDHIPNFDISQNQCEETGCWWIGPGGEYEPEDELFCYFDPYWNVGCTGCMDTEAINYDMNATIECDDNCDGEEGDCCEYALNNNNLTINQNIKISQIFPNPFNPKTNIIIDMPSYAFTELNIYNISGQLIQNIHRNYLDEGTHTFNWNGEKFQSGIYIVRVSARNKSDSYLIHLLK
tara:strand:+ start:2184 stop:2831 length:648 start_codon:yes stop_codon:yes gene_type:complete